MFKNAILVVLICALTERANGYDTDTHAWVTHHAFLRSRLNPATATPVGLIPLTDRLGFDRLDELTPFRVSFELPILTPLQSDGYLDLAPGGSPYANSPIPFRAPQEYERVQMRVTDININNSLFTTPNKIEAALVRGAIREDDLKPEDFGTLAPDPDPYGNIRRVAWHFWDPINDIPLTFPPSPIPTSCDGSGVPISVFDTPCLRSIDAAIGVENALAPSFNPALSRRNHFSWLDAREYFWNALTFKVVNSNYSLGQARDAAVRKNYWHSTILSLGHVAHLIQDGAQPQHTRNDRHNPNGTGTFFGGLPATPLGRRTMEAYGNYRVTGDVLSLPEGERSSFRGFFNGPARDFLLTKPTIGSYPTPSFATPVKFFSTKSENTSLNQRRGLIDFSNRGFFSEGTRLGQFQSPPPNIADPAYTFAQGASYQIPQYGTLSGSKLLWTVPDPVSPSYVDSCSIGGKIPVATVSSLSQFASASTGALGAPIQLALDDYNANRTCYCRGQSPILQG
jgi:hypothetical protein